MTPLEKLASLPDAARFLRPGTTLTALHELANALSDLDAARELAEARQALFKRAGTRTA